MPSSIRVLEKVVPGAYGVGKVKILYKPKRPLRIRWITFVIYTIFFGLVYLCYSWNVLEARYSTVIPFVRWAFKQVDTVKWLLSSIPKQIRDEKIQEIQSRKGDVVHIEADSSLDLFFKQGQHHALDRHYQLEIYRRLATGNLSALMGNKSMEMDITAKTLNFAGLAQQDLDQLDANTKEVLQAYSNGINSVILTESYHTLPLDFAWTQSGWALLFEQNRMDIQPWEPVHSLAIARLLYYEWSHGWEDELLLQLFEERLGKTKAASFKTKLVEDSVKVSKNVEYLPSLGGNVIAVGKDNSKSGSAFLVHDLQTTGHYFGFWYANTLKATDFDVSGLSFPGIPYVLIGRNEKISWAFVQSQQRDLEDVFLVRKNTKTDIKFTARTESIVVHGRNVTVDFEVLDSPYGTDVTPMLSNSVKGAVINSNINHVILASQAINKPVNLDAFRLLNQAKNVEGLHVAAQKLQSVALNLVYATADGNVGYIHTGSAPVRSEGSTGSVPMLFKTENVWKGVNDPHDENIDLGHANGVVIAGDSLSSKALFRRLASSCFDLEKNILEHCGKKEMYSTRKYSIDEIESVLVDAYSPTGHALSTLVQALVYTNEEKKAMQDDQEFGSNAIPYDEDIEKFNIPYVMNALNDFDGYYHPNSVAPTIIEGFRTALLSNSLKDLGPLHLSLVGVPISGILRPLALDSFRYTKTINFFKHSSNRWMFERNGHLEKALLSSLAETFNWIDSSFPKSTKELLKPSNKGLITPRKYVDWKWADAHLVTFLHPVTRVAEILDTFWSVGPVRGIGGLDTVLRTSYRNDIGLSNPDALSSSHSFVTTNRVVVDMGTKQGFKTINTAVGPSIRLAFDVNLDQKFNQLLSPSLNSKHVVSQSAESCKDGVCAAEGATSKMDTKAQQEL